MIVFNCPRLRELSGNSTHSLLTVRENSYTIVRIAGCEVLHHDRPETEHSDVAGRSQFMTFERVGSQDEHS